ncbi:hypothetical protein COLO4_32364 [Corchorus olitorius]|uniref:Uncharacterized protein n=1 Tax=Corchorus olitorius TaxID=93759 RepID=A0A1R3GZN8_9ROSI|nr:hypothetical protein COLO4_32364 [Corchorus olitorius]
MASKENLSADGDASVSKGFFRGLDEFADSNTLFLSVVAMGVDLNDMPGRAINKEISRRSSSVEAVDKECCHRQIIYHLNKLVSTAVGLLFLRSKGLAYDFTTQKLVGRDIELCRIVVLGFRRRMVLKIGGAASCDWLSTSLAAGYKTWHSASPLPLSSAVATNFPAITRTSLMITAMVFLGSSPMLTNETICSATSVGINLPSPAIENDDVAIEKDTPIVDTDAAVREKDIPAVEIIVAVREKDIDIDFVDGQGGTTTKDPWLMPQATEKDVPVVGTHAEIPAVGTHAIASAVGTHAEAPAVGTHAETPTEMELLPQVPLRSVSMATSDGVDESAIKNCRRADQG